MAVQCIYCLKNKRTLTKKISFILITNIRFFFVFFKILRKFAKHFQTGEPMPEALIQKLCASKHVFAASELQVQVFYSALDQKYHDLPLGDKTTTQILEETQRDYYSLPYVPNTVSIIYVLSSQRLV